MEEVMTDDQQRELQRLNDTRGVAAWRIEDSVLYVTMDDGDEVIVYSDGKTLDG